MRTYRPLFTGLLSAAASTIMVVGAISLALAEGFTLTLPTAPVQTEPPVVAAQPFETQNSLASPSSVPPSLTWTPLPMLVTATPSQPASCPVPIGWNQYMIQSGDSLANLAVAAHVDLAILKQANCLMTLTLLPGTFIYLPPTPPTLTPSPIPTATRIPCGPPAGWILHQIHYGDTLFQISLAYGVSVPDLMRANCLTSYTIQAGQWYYVPNVPTRMPPPSLTPLPATATRLPSTSTITQTVTTAPQFTLTPTHTSTATPTATATHTHTPTLTATATSTATATHTATATATDTTVPAATPTETSTSTVSAQAASQ